jgi:hypothetical protein
MEATETPGNCTFPNGVKLYSEIYGKGDPLILLHGNGGNIKGIKHQNEFLSKKCKVTVMHWRGRGKSELGKDSLTYMQMTTDVASLMVLVNDLNRRVRHLRPGHCLINPSVFAKILELPSIMDVPGRKNWEGSFVAYHVFCLLGATVGS